MMYRVVRQCFLALWLYPVVTYAFVPVNRPTMFQASKPTTSLQMAKKLKNKQAEMAKKMADAKKQTTGCETPEDASGKAILSDQEVKEQNDRLRFEELLKTQSSSVLNDFSSDGYLNAKQEEEEIMASSEY
jgi:hypothetical protein